MHAESSSHLPLVHDHGPAHGLQASERRTRWVVGVTAVMMVVELVVGRWTGSMALTADGWHMATHVGALGLSAGAYWFARTRSGHRAFSFGTGKVYALAGYTSALSLAAVAVWMLGESAERIFHPVSVQFGEALPVAVLGLVVNIVSAKLLDHDEHGHHDHEHGHDEHEHDEHRDAPKDHHHDHNLRAAYMHVVADAITSVLAIAALLAGRFLGWTGLDPVMGVVGGIVILNWGWGLCGSAARQLLDVTPSRDAEDVIRRELEAVDDVKVTDLHLWELGPGRRGCIVALVTSTPRETAHYRTAILAKAHLAHLTVEVHRHARDTEPLTAS